MGDKKVTFPIFPIFARARNPAPVSLLGIWGYAPLCLQERSCAKVPPPNHFVEHCVPSESCTMHEGVSLASHGGLMGIPFIFNDMDHPPNSTCCLSPHNS